MDRTQRAEGKVFLAGPLPVIQTSGAIDGNRFSTGKRKLTFLSPASILATDYYQVLTVDCGNRENGSPKAGEPAGCSS